MPSQCGIFLLPPVVKSVLYFDFDNVMQVMSHVDGKNRRGIHVRAYSYSYSIHVQYYSTTVVTQAP